MVPRDDRSFGTVAAAASFLAIGLAAIYWTARIGFTNPIKPVIQVAGLSLFLINAPRTLTMFTNAARGRWAWATTHSFYWLATVLFAVLAGRYAGASALPVFVALGFATCLLTIADWLRSGSLWRSAIVMVGSLAFSTFAGGVVWGRIYKSPLFMEMLRVDGVVHHDPIGLAGLANMLLTYRIPTPGLDGIPHMAYHWGTPWMFAQLSQLLGTSTLEFYNFGYVVTMLPFFFGGILCFATQIHKAWTPDIRFDLRENLPLLGLFLVAVVGVFPITGMDKMGVWTSNLMISESYGAGLPVALLLFAITVVYSKSESRDWVFPAIVLPLGILLLGYLKISLMILGFLAAMYVGVRKRLYRQPGFLVIGVALTAAFFFTYSNVSLPEHREGVVPLDFLKGFVPPSWWPYFLLVHLFWSWAYIALRLREEGIRTFADLRAGLKSRKILDTEIVFLVAAAGIGPGLVTHIDGGSAFYFSDVQRWLSVGLIIAGTGSRLRLPVLLSKPSGGFSLGRTRLRTILVLFIAAPLVASFFANSVYWTRRMIEANRNTRNAIANAGGVQATKNHLLISELQSLAGVPRQERSRTALFIPQAEAKYWNLLERPGACSFAGHVAPTLTGMAMVDGMPGYGCDLSRYYGLGLFEARSAPQMPADTLPDNLCRRAGRYGLARVLTVHFDSTGRASRRVDECRTAP